MNIIVYGIDESGEQEAEARKSHDREKLEDIMDSISCEGAKTKVNKLIRLGKRPTDEELSHGRKPRVPDPWK